MRIDGLELEKVLREELAVPCDRRVHLELAPGDAVEECVDGWLAAYLRLVIWDGGQIQDVREQRCALVPADVRDDAGRVAAYVRQWARSFTVILAAHDDDVSQLLPVDFTDFRALLDRSLVTDADFEAVLQDVAWHRERVEADRRSMADF